jgi:hypothetical protein
MTSSRARIAFPFLCSLFVFGALAGYGCGGSSSGTDAVALCNQFCNKYNSLCAVDAGPINISIDCATTCTPAMVSQKTTNCPNSSAIISATQACVNKTTCTDLTTCAAGIPQCSSGAGGTSGGAGTSGSAGTSGAAGTTGSGGRGAAGATGSGGRGAAGTTGTGGTGATGTCADLLACCNATTNATLKSACMTSYTTVMSMGDATCGQILAQIKSAYCP